MGKTEMSAKKKSSAKADKKTVSRRKSPRTTLFWGNGEIFPLTSDSNGRRHTQPYRLNPETVEEREKRLTAREKQTLQAFQAAYESHHRGRRKTS
jgi:hypothetical protein